MRPARGAGLAAVVFALPVLALPVLFAAFAGGSGCANGSAGLIAGTRGIPAGLVPVFNQAARAWDVNAYLLASIADQESGFGAGSAWRIANGSGCVGFMQICVGGAGGDTWDTPQPLTQPRPAGASSLLAPRGAYRYGGPRPAPYPLETPDHPNYDDPFDAVTGGAVVLRGKLAGRSIPRLDQTAYQAACRYYGACADSHADYAPAVLARARQWQTTNGLATNATATPAAAQACGADQTAAELLPGARYASPVPGRLPAVTSPFCEARSYETCHPGVDLAVPTGTPILAIGPGRIRLATNTDYGGYGKYICLEHTEAISSCYAHLARLNVVVGQYVQRGQQIGISDCTGRCYGPHLHFEIRVNGAVTCPAPYLAANPTTWCAPGWQRRVGSDSAI